MRKDLDYEIDAADSLLDVLLIMEKVILKNTHVGTLAFVKEVYKEYDEDGYGILICDPFPLNQGQEQYSIQAYYFNRDLEFSPNDKVLIVFTDLNFISNLNVNDNKPRETQDNIFHSLKCGVVIPFSAAGGESGKYVRYDTNTQGLTTIEKQNARINIGAGTSNFSGAYGDLSGKPDLSIYAKSDDLATVATSGDYNDLLNKPDLSIYAEKDWVEDNYKIKNKEFLVLGYEVIKPAQYITASTPIKILFGRKKSKSFCEKETKVSVSLQGKEIYGKKIGNRISRYSFNLLPNTGYSFNSLLFNMLGSTFNYIFSYTSGYYLFEDAGWVNGNPSQELFETFRKMFPNNISENNYNNDDQVTPGDEKISIPNAYYIQFLLSSGYMTEDYELLAEDFLKKINSDLYIDRGKSWYNTFNDTLLDDLYHELISDISYRTRVMIKFVKDFNQIDNEHPWTGEMSNYWLELQIGFNIQVVPNQNDFIGTIGFHFTKKRFS